MSAKLGDILITQGVIDHDKLISALSDQRAFGGKLGRTLIDLGYVTEDELLLALSTQLGLDIVDLEETEVLPEALRCIPVDACERYGVFPVRVDEAERVLWVATAEPDRQVLQEVAQISQYTLEPMLASMSSIERALRRSYFGDTTLGSVPRDFPLAAPRPRSVPNRSAEAAFPDDLVAEPESYATGAVAPAGDPPAAMEELKALIIRLERTVNAQSRAFRALVDLLQQKGIVRRGELGQRTTRK